MDLDTTIFDTHCHLGYGDQDPAASVGRAAAVGVTQLLTVGIDLASSRRAQAISSAHDGVVYAAGLHPNSAAQLTPDWRSISELCAQPDCVAVGETGLDYYWDRCPPTRQKAALRQHLALAAELQKPVIIHSRDAFTDIFDELAAFPLVEGVLHCFSGGIAEARRGLELGYYLSFAGPLTYPKTRDLQAAAAFAPPDRILVETDAPFLPPHTNRGQTNEPAYIIQTLTRLAELRGIDFEAAARITTDNGRRLFGVA